MAKAKGKKSASKKARRASAPTAAQKRAQADFKAFRADNGRGPRAGESIKGYATGKRPGPLRRGVRWVRRHPVKTAVGVLTGGLGLASATEGGRRRLGTAKDSIRSHLPR